MSGYTSKTTKDRSFSAGREVLLKQKAQKGWKVIPTPVTEAGGPPPTRDLPKASPGHLFSLASFCWTRHNVRNLSVVNKDETGIYQTTQGKAVNTQIHHILLKGLSLSRMLFVLCCHFHQKSRITVYLLRATVSLFLLMTIESKYYMNERPVR